MNLAQFYRRHLAPSLGGSHLPLARGLRAVGRSEARGHRVARLVARADAASRRRASRCRDHARVVEARQAAEAAALAALASSPRRLRAFRRLLADAQHLVPIREEQIEELTIAWPVMRRAVLRIGEALAERGVIANADDVFFLTRAEALAALDGEPRRQPVDVPAAARRCALEQARSGAAAAGRPREPDAPAVWDSFPRLIGARPSDAAPSFRASPASAGRATGTVRVIRGPEEFDQLQAGEILVAPLTAPAWTPLFTRAAAVVTDVGSAAAHASIIAREYGIPAVVGCGDATARLRRGCASRSMAAPATSSPRGDRNWA